jgi:hypothetical protein
MKIIPERWFFDAADDRVAGKFSFRAGGDQARSFPMAVISPATLKN